MIGMKKSASAVMESVVVTDEIPRRRSDSAMSCFLQHRLHRWTFAAFVSILLLTFAVTEVAAREVKHDQYAFNANSASQHVRRVRRQTPALSRRHNPILASAYVPESLTTARLVNPGSSDRVYTSRGSSCPSLCTCYPGNEVRCAFRRLRKMPNDVPSNVQKLNLAYNKLRRLPRDAFARFAPSLKFLYLQSNDLRAVTGEFSNLNKVEILRLSWNKLSVIRKSTLTDLVALKRLFLDKNRLTFIHPAAFRGLTNLRLLQLEGNRLSRLHSDTFVTLRFERYFSFSHIQYLYLSNNKFKILPRSLLSGITSLRHVYLHGNPWECTCHLLWLHQWIRESGKYRCKKSVLRRGDPPTCATCSTPANLAGHVITRVPHDSITCTTPHLIGTEEFEQSQMFPGDPSLLELENEAALFRAGSAPTPRMSMRLDGRGGSLVFMHCNASRAPLTSVSVDNNANVTYIGHFELMMDCKVEYPENRRRLDSILGPYLNSALSFTAEGVPPFATRPRVNYQVQIQDEPLTVLAPLGSGMRVSAAALLTDNRVFKTDRSTITIFGNRFRPEEGKLSLLFQNSRRHTLSQDSHNRDLPWTMLNDPSPLRVIAHMAMEGQTATIKCKSMGFPKPLSSWILPDGSLVRNSRRLGRFKASRGGRLLIRSVNKGDEGIYRCLSQSIQTIGSLPGGGRVAEDLGPILLQVIPSEADDTAVMDHVTVVEGSDWTSTCQAQGIPAPIVAWIPPSNRMLIGGTKTPVGGVMTYRNGTIFIDEVLEQHEGLYRCVASNRIGYARVSTFLRVTSSNTSRRESERTTVESRTMTSQLTIRPTQLASTLSRDRTTTDMTVTARTNLNSDVDRVAINKQPSTLLTSTLVSTQLVTINNPMKTTTSPQRHAVEDDVTMEPTLILTNQHEDDVIASRNNETMGDATTTAGFLHPSIITSSQLSQHADASHSDSSNTEVLLSDIEKGNSAPEEENSSQRHRDTQEIIRVNYNDPFVLTCPLEDDGSAVSWNFHPRQSAASRQSRESVSEVLSRDQPESARHVAKTLSISRATERHNGTFICRRGSNDVHRAYVIVTSSAPRFTQPGFSGITIDYGNALSIPCSADGIPSPTITWSWPMHDVMSAAMATDNTLMGRSRVYTEPDHVLHIKNVSPAYGVTYLCTATNEFGKVVHPVLISVSSLAPNIQEYSGPTSIRVGRSIRLDCLAHAVPVPRRVWILPSGESLISTNESWSKMKILTNGSLSIKSVDQSDAGSYGCIVTNAVGEASIQINLQVLRSQTAKPRREVSISTPTTATFPSTTTSIASVLNNSTTVVTTDDVTTPRVTKQPTTNFINTYRVRQRVRHDATAYLRCRTRFPREVTSTQSRRRFAMYSRHSRVTVRWTTPSGDPVGFPSPVPSWRHRVYRNGTLKIRRSDLSDGGIYICIATNSKGKKMRTSVNLVIATQLPSFNQGLYDVMEVRRDRSVSAECSAEGFPKPRITWTTPSGRTYTAGSFATGFRVLSSGRLIIYNINTDSAGAYTCQASNAAGNVTRVVNFKLHSFAPTIISAHTMTQYVKMGKSVKFTCPAEGVPAPYQYWILPNGKTIELNEGVFELGQSRSKMAMLPSGSLNINRADKDDAGYYRCYATNRMGNDMKTVHLMVYN